MVKHSRVPSARRMLETSEVCDYRKETPEGSGDATLPGMSVWSRSRIAGPKSTFTVSAKAQVSM